MPTEVNHTQVNLSKLCSNLNAFRTAEKYVDVIIQCKDVSFRCHRIILALASSFFDTMFNSNFKECREDSISLTKISPKIFDDVLQFIYTGDVTITSANAIEILEASEFFGLPGIEMLVIEFVQKKGLCVQNTLDMFHFVCKTKKEKLMKMLSFNIARNLGNSSRQKGFLEISFEDLNYILTCYNVDLWWIRYDDVLLFAITRWINHCREDRLQYFNKLCHMIENLNPVWMRYMITNFASNLDYSLLLTQIEKLGGFYNIVEMLPYTEDESLHIFVGYEKENLIRVFSIAEDDDKCSFFCEIPKFQSNQWMKCIAFNEYNCLYFLQYVRRNWKNSYPSACAQSFCVSSSTDFGSVGSVFSLEAPPVIFGDVNLCSLYNQIYVYNQTLSACIPSATSNSGSFSAEEINRGIYVYNRELDMWFPVPALMKKLQNSCMTSLYDRLYLIGGEPIDGTSYENYAQAYDPREGIWEALPTTTYNYVGADCCRSFYKENLVDVCGGVFAAFEEYNTVAGKWDVLTPMPTQRQYHRLTCSYVSDKLYVMGGDNDDLSIQIFDPNSNEGLWLNSSVIAEATEKITGTTKGATILDNVVFKN